ncbi:MAG TPA: hypothetical protein VN622_05715 [Clostridia bacterium]|nr:hypothetical protein [Clostridia bacterium]
MSEYRTVLIVSYQPQTVDSHAQALGEAGYEVQRAQTMSAALGAVGPGKIEAMVLGPDIPAGDRRRIEGEARRRNERIRIVLMYEGERERDVFASAILDVSEPTTKLVETIGSILSEQK